MSERLAQLFHPVSQQLVRAGSKLSEAEHLRCFRFATAVLHALDRRVSDFVELIDGAEIDMADPGKDPFSIVAEKDADYRFLRTAKASIMSQVCAEEEFEQSKLADPDAAACVNAFMKETLAVIRSRRTVSISTAA